MGDKSQKDKNKSRKQKVVKAADAEKKRMRRQENALTPGPVKK
jgi:hypothetical protein